MPGGDSRYFGQLPDHRLRRAVQASAERRQKRASERESMLRRIVELSGVKIEVLLHRIYAFKEDEYPQEKRMTPRIVTAYLLKEDWVWDTNSVVNYLYAQLCSNASKAGWKKRKEWEEKQAEKDAGGIPLLAQAGARVKIPRRVARQKKQERAEKNKAKEEARKIATEKKKGALADFGERQKELW